MRLLLFLLIPLLPTHAAILLPLEIIGQEPFDKKVTVTVPVGYPVTHLWVKAHGLTATNKGAVKVGTNEWILLNNATVIMPEPAKSYGGIGGGFSTLSFSVRLPTNSVPAGPLDITWRYNDVTPQRERTGWRVLAFDFLSGTNRLLEASNFVEDDPAQWKPLLGTSPEIISEGRRLWTSAPISHRGKAIEARCRDCHTHDGRDLKYFNYSDEFIIQQAIFHGLCEAEGKLIATYLRSLPVPYIAKGRPWNPPYQPGPGMDSVPVHEWAAGAGLEWVLDSDNQTFDYIFPDGVKSEAIDFKGMLNTREIPVAFQFPDWNHWLCELHPFDSYGKVFTDHSLWRKYGSIRANMQRISATNRVAAAKYLMTESQRWYDDAVNFFGRSGSPAVPIPTHPWPMDHQIRYMSTIHWRNMKLWEIMTEFGMEDFGKEAIGSHANDRTWFDAMVFNTAPHLLQLEAHNHPIRNGNLVNFNYFTVAWYQLGITLNNSNKRPYGTTPVDWPYLYAYLGSLSTPTVGHGGVLYLNLVVGAQAGDNGINVTNWNRGWDPCYRANAHLLLPEPNNVNTFRQVPPEQRLQVVEAYLENWIEKTASYPPSAYWFNGMFARKNETIGTDAMGGRWIDRYAALRNRAKVIGVNPQLVQRLTDFGKQCWPSNNWN